MSTSSSSSDTNDEYTIQVSGKIALYDIIPLDNDIEFSMIIYSYDPNEFDSRVIPNDILPFKAPLGNLDDPQPFTINIPFKVPFDRIIRNQIELLVYSKHYAHDILANPLDKLGISKDKLGIATTSLLTLAQRSGTGTPLPIAIVHPECKPGEKMGEVYLSNIQINIENDKVKQNGFMELVQMNSDKNILLDYNTALHGKDTFDRMLGKDLSSKRPIDRVVSTDLINSTVIALKHLIDIDTVHTDKEKEEQNNIWAAFSSPNHLYTESNSSGVPLIAFPILCRKFAELSISSAIVASDPTNREMVVVDSHIPHILSLLNHWAKLATLLHTKGRTARITRNQGEIDVNLLSEILTMPLHGMAYTPDTKRVRGIIPSRTRLEPSEQWEFLYANPVLGEMEYDCEDSALLALCNLQLLYAAYNTKEILGAACPELRNILTIANKYIGFFAIVELYTGSTKSDPYEGHAAVVLISKKSMINSLRSSQASTDASVENKDYGFEAMSRDKIIDYEGRFYDDVPPAIVETTTYMEASCSNTAFTDEKAAAEFPDRYCVLKEANWLSDDPELLNFVTNNQPSSKDAARWLVRRVKTKAPIAAAYKAGEKDEKTRLNCKLYRRIFGLITPFAYKYSDKIRSDRVAFEYFAVGATQYQKPSYQIEYGPRLFDIFNDENRSLRPGYQPKLWSIQRLTYRDITSTVNLFHFTSDFPNAMFPPYDVSDEKAESIYNLLGDKNVQILYVAKGDEFIEGVDHVKYGKLIYRLLQKHINTQIYSDVPVDKKPKLQFVDVPLCKGLRMRVFYVQTD